MKPWRVCGGRCASSSRYTTISTARSGIFTRQELARTSSAECQPSDFEVSMTVTTNFFQQPRLRESVTMQMNGDACILHYREQEHEIGLAAGMRTEAKRLLEMLHQGGYSLDELSRELPLLSEDVGRFCRDRDRFGLLTETLSKPVQAKRGLQFYRELRRFIERVQRKYSTRPYYQGLISGTLGREQLIGYALEY